MPAVQARDLQPPLILSLDIGTSSARALIYDRLGRWLDGVEGRREYQLQTSPDGGAVLDADELIAAVETIIDSALAQGAPAVAPHGIAAVAACTFWHSMLGIGRGGRACTPLYTWADTRSSAAAERLKQRVDPRAVHDRTGAVLHPSYFPARLAWLNETQPGLAASVDRWLSPGEYLHERLFGRSYCSVSMASGTGLLDENRQQWDEELLRILNLRPEQLSPLADTNTPLEGLCGDYAQRWPALAHARWHPALGDGACNNIGSGCVSPDRVAVMVGTSGAMRVVWEAARVNIPPGLWCYRIDGRRFVLGGALTGGGDIFVWLRRLLAFDDTPRAALEAQLEQMLPDGHGLTLLPFPAGERSTGWAADARAAISGLTFLTRPLDLLRAGMEAVALRFALIARELQRDLPPAREVIASGGALLGSPAWTQIMADVLGRPVIASAESEASSRGAALLVLEAMGALRSLDDAPAALGRVFQPTAEHTARYMNALERQQRLYHCIVEQGIER